jgi:hypothetical protein
MASACILFATACGIGLVGLVPSGAILATAAAGGAGATAVTVEERIRTAGFSPEELLEEDEWMPPDLIPLDRLVPFLPGFGDNCQN